MRILIGLFSMGTIAGCDPLAGTFAGTVTCQNEEAYGLAVQLDFEGHGEGEYTGSGRIGYIDCATNNTNNNEEPGDCELRFNMDTRLDKLTGEQDLDVDYSDCRYAAVPGTWENVVETDTGVVVEVMEYDSPPTDCRDQVEELSWDGQDSISWKRFWTPDVPCVGTLKRK